MSELRATAKHPEIIPEKTCSRLKYTDVYDNTDIVYDLTGGQLKESIVIGSYCESLYGYQYRLEVGDMNPILSDSGEIMLYARNGTTPIFVMPAPYLLDSAGVYCNDVKVDLQSDDDGYMLTYTLPVDWMADSTRQWPVILDPVIRKEADFSNSEDQNVYKNPHIYTPPSSGTVTCGYDPTCNAIRFYLKYKNLPDITSADVVVNANL